MYTPLPRHPPADPRHPRHTEEPAGQARRHAPEVDLEWPAPKPDRSLDLFIWSILSLSLASAIALRDSVLLLLSPGLLLGACALALLDAYPRREDAGRAIARAVRSIDKGEQLGSVGQSSR